MSVEIYPRLLLADTPSSFVSRIDINWELVDTQEQIANAVEMHDYKSRPGEQLDSLSYVLQIR